MYADFVVRTPVLDNDKEAQSDEVTESAYC